MTDALATGFADELTPEDQTILNGGEAPVPESGDTPADKATSADPPKQEASTPDLSAKDDDEESVEVENKGRFVRHGAFHAERQQRKALERRLAEITDKFTRGDERLRLLSEAMAPKPEVQQPAEPPDPEKDIFAYLKWQSDQIRALSGNVGETSKVIQETTAETQLKTAYVTDVKRFLGDEKNADFGQAYTFLMTGRDAELAASGIDDPNERMQIIQNEEKWLVQRALQSKPQASPAERIYALAKARGYKAPEAALAPPANNGAAERIAAITKALPATQSLSNVGGSSGSDALTMEALASMSEDEYAAIKSKLSPAKWQEIMSS